MGDEQAAGGMKGREAWWLVLPEPDSGANQALELLKWVVGELLPSLRLCKSNPDFCTGIHDAFGLYGRPNAYAWDPRESTSQMFAYPVGPQKDVCVSFGSHGCSFF